jgi:DNA-3-methyladenine glycosylase
MSDRSPRPGGEDQACAAADAWRPLPRSFFARRADILAPELLGRWLVRELPDERLVLRLVEVEAYLGRDDPASHAFRGETPRNRTMFGEPAHLYVYLIYGLHHCLNVVAGTLGVPHAVLLRAAEVVEGEASMIGRRGLQLPAKAGSIAGGPGRLGQALGVDRGLDGSCLLSGPLRLVEGRPVAPDQIVRGPRVGIDYAGDAAAWPLRFAVDAHPEVSRPRRGLERWVPTAG